MKLLWLLTFLEISYLTNADYYTAISGLESLLKMESFLIENLENYMKAELEKNTFIKQYIANAEQELKHIGNHSLQHFENPLNAWRDIKRICRDWRDLIHMTFDKRTENAYRNRLTTHEKTYKFGKPTVADLHGAATGKKVSMEMSSSDCFSLGRSLYTERNFKYAASWLLESRNRLALEKQAGKTGLNVGLRLPKEDLIVETLISAILETGNNKLAELFIQEQLANHPQDINALNSTQNIAQKLQEERFKLYKYTVNEPEKQKPDTLMKLYKKTCRGDLKQTPREQRKLRCRYVTNNVPYCLIAPFKIEEYNLDPFVAVYYDAIHDSEIKNIFSVAEKNVERSRLGSGAVSNIRTSKSTWLWYHKHAFLKNIAQRLTYITGLNIATAEALQVANYGIGGHYAPHYDFSLLENYSYNGTGNRILTAMFYINDVELGGATAFPHLKIAVSPIKRSLVVWYNLHRSLELDYRTKHAGCPVIKGSKWISNEWFHSVGQEFCRPCGLTADGHKSIKFSDDIMFKDKN